MSLLSPPLHAFMAIAKHKTVHAAAEKIHITQTAVTQRIRTLERQLKTTLFIRTRRGMQLTQEGESLLRYCHAATELEGETLAMIQGAGRQTDIEITICAPSSLMRSRVISSCLPILQAFPHLLIKFDVDDIEHRHQKLRSGSADIVVIRQEDVASEMQHKQLKAEQYVLVASPQWEGRNTKDIIKQERIIDYDPTDQLTFEYLKHYDLFDLCNHNRHYINKTEYLASLVSQGVGYTVLDKEFTKPYVKRNELIILNKEKTLNSKPVLAWFDRPEPPTYFSTIINAIK